MTHSDHWYAASLVVASTVGGVRSDNDLLDLQVKLIRAPDLETARRRAIELGKQEDHSYPNADGEIVAWQFKGIHRIEELEDATLVDGGEVFSVMLRETFEKFLEAQKNDT